MLSRKKQNELLIDFLHLESKGFKEIFRDVPNVGSRFVKKYGFTNCYLEFRIFRNRFFGMHGWLENTEVESILEELLVKNGFEKSLIGWTLSTYYLVKINKPMIKKHSDSQKIELSTEENVREVAEMILHLIDNLYIPIFNKFSVLEEINKEIIQKLPHAEVSNYINSHMSLKKLIIMKLCNNPDYETYSNWLYNALKERNDRGEDEGYYKLFVDLKNKLED